MSRLISCHRSLIFKSTFAALMYMLSSSAWAGFSSAGTLTYGPLLKAEPIPALSGPMLVILALLMATIGYRIQQKKDKNSSRMMVLALICVSAFASGASGVKLIADANANGFPEIFLTEQNGGSVSVPDSPNHYVNKTGDFLEIKNRTAQQRCVYKSIINECEVGKKLAKDELCNLDMDCASID